MRDLTKVKVPGFVLGKVIGEGAYKVAIDAHDETGLGRYVVKIIDPSRINSTGKSIIERMGVSLDDYINSEFQKLAQINAIPGKIHIPEIVPVSVDSGLVAYAEKYAGSINLQDYILKRFKENNPLSLDEFTIIGHEVIEAICELHKAGFIHADTKPANFIIDPDTYFVTVTDFGQTSMTNSDSNLHGINFGSIHNRAPEVFLDNRNISKASDVWGVGATLYFMATGRYFLPQEQDARSDFKDAQDRLEYEGKIREEVLQLTVPKILKRIEGLPYDLSGFLNPNPEHRFEIEDVLGKIKTVREEFLNRKKRTEFKLVSEAMVDGILNEDIIGNEDIIIKNTDLEWDSHPIAFMQLNGGYDHSATAELPAIRKPFWSPLKKWGVVAAGLVLAAVTYFGGEYSKKKNLDYEKQALKPLVAQLGNTLDAGPVLSEDAADPLLRPERVIVSDDKDTKLLVRHQVIENQRYLVLTYDDKSRRTQSVRIPDISEDDNETIELKIDQENERIIRGVPNSFPDIFITSHLKTGLKYQCIIDYETKSRFKIVGNILDTRIHDYGLINPKKGEQLVINIGEHGMDLSEEKFHFVEMRMNKPLIAKFELHEASPEYTDFSIYTDHLAVFLVNTMASIYKNLGDQEELPHQFRMKYSSSYGNWIVDREEWEKRPRLRFAEEGDHRVEFSATYNGRSIDRVWNFKVLEPSNPLPDLVIDDLHIDLFSPTLKDDIKFAITIGNNGRKRIEGFKIAYQINNSPLTLEEIGEWAESRLSSSETEELRRLYNSPNEIYKFGQVLKYFALKDSVPIAFDSITVNRDPVSPSNTNGVLTFEELLRPQELLRIDHKLKHRISSEGIYTIRVQLDPEEEIKDSNMDNNRAFKYFRVQKKVEQ